MVLAGQHHIPEGEVEGEGEREKHNRQDDKITRYSEEEGD